MNKKIALNFVVGSFCLSWLMWGAIIIANQFGYLKFQTPLCMVLYIIGGLAPTVASIVISLKNKVMPAKQLFKTIFALKQPVPMYLLVIGFTVLYFGVGALTDIFEYKSPIYLSLLMFPIMVVGGGLEEVGWRFLLQPELEKKFPFAIATSITAAIWSIWHLPLFYIVGTNQYNWNFGLFTIGCFGLAFVLAAIYRISKSVWLCVFFHAIVNALYESFAMRVDNFNRDFIPAVITMSVLIIASILTVIAAKKVNTVPNEHL